MQNSAIVRHAKAYTHKRRVDFPMNRKPTKCGKLFVGGPGPGSLEITVPGFAHHYIHKMSAGDGKPCGGWCIRQLNKDRYAFLPKGVFLLGTNDSLKMTMSQERLQRDHDLLSMYTRRVETGVSHGQTVLRFGAKPVEGRFNSDACVLSKPVQAFVSSLAPQKPGFVMTCTRLVTTPLFNCRLNEDGEHFHSPIMMPG